jgi:hypothetical protein
MSVSKNPQIQNDMAHFARVPKDRTYEFLLSSIDRYLDLQTLNYNRLAIENDLGRGNKNIHANTQAGKGKGNNQKGDSSNQQANAGGKGKKKPDASTPGPCWFHNNGGCNKGKDCRYSHQKLPKEEAAKLQKPGSRGRTPSPSNSQKGG